jgi:HK97 family phage major capsid protein
MRSTKVINEESEDAEMQRDRLIVEAKGLFEEAKRGNRGLTKNEASRFDTLTNKPNGSISQQKNLIASLQAELAQTQEQQRQIIAMSQSRNPSTSVYQNTYSGDAVLPTNGVLPNEQQGNQIFPQVRSQRLRAFGNESQALAGGLFLRVIDARLGDRGLDAVAEEMLHSKFNLQITNSSYEGSGVSGGYLVPPQISQTIIDVREKVGVARQVCQI